MRKVQVQGFIFLLPVCFMESWCIVFFNNPFIPLCCIYYHHWNSFSGLSWAACRTSLSWEHGWRTLWYLTIIWKRRSGKWQRNRFGFLIVYIYFLPKNNNIYTKCRSSLICGVCRFVVVVVSSGALRLSNIEVWFLWHHIG